MVRFLYLNSLLSERRATTERPEGIKAGTLKLVGTSEEVIYNEFKKLIDN